MLYQKERLDAITDNLAHSSVPGHKKTVSSQRAFDAMYHRASAIPDAFSGDRRSRAADLAVDFSPGPMRNTGNPLDFAIAGDGFFVLDEGDGRELYTRNGRFQLDPDGNVVTTAGYAVQGEGGTLRLPPELDLAKLTVDGDGTLRAGEEIVGAMRVAWFEDPAQMARVGPTLFSAPDGEMPQQPLDARVVNRAVEGSNASIFEEMADLISTTRSFEACQRMIKQLDQAQGETIRRLSS